MTILVSIDTMKGASKGVEINDGDSRTSAIKDRKAEVQVAPTVPSGRIGPTTYKSERRNMVIGLFCLPSRQRTKRSCWKILKVWAKTCRSGYLILC